MNGIYIGAYLGKEKRCPICKKKFMVCTEEWGFKDRGKYYCSWKCLRAHENAASVYKGKAPTEKRDAIFQAFNRGETLVEICEKLDVSMSTVKYYRTRWNPGEAGEENG